MWAYFDTSAVVKRYVEEGGRREVLQLMRQHECVASAVLLVELRGALRRRVSAGTLEAGRVRGILKRIASDRAYWTLVGVGTDVLRAAATLVRIHPLRTLDAIHVASAQLFTQRARTDDLIFVSGDKRQTAVAAAVGLMVKHVGD